MHFSLTALEIRNRLQADSGEALPATLLFEHPTASAVVAELIRRLVRGEPAKRSPDRPSSPVYVDFDL